METFTGIALIDRLLDATPSQTNRHGNPVRRIFYPSSRYLFDANLDWSVWSQLDTESDAAYFGVWVSKTHHRLLCYAEGDIDFVQCVDAEHYDLELAELCERHPPTPAFTTIDDGMITHHYEDRREHFIDPDRCPPSPIQFDDSAGESS